MLSNASTTRHTPVQALPAGTVTRAMILGERPAEKVTVGLDNGTAVLYLHGGGYTIGSIATHRSLAAHIARGAGAAVYLLDYRLAPARRCPRARASRYRAYARYRRQWTRAAPGWWCFVRT